MPIRVLSLLLLCASSLNAQHVVIGRQHRVPNRPQGCCGYAVAEAVSSHLGHTSLKGDTAAKAALPYKAPYMHPVCGVQHPHPGHAWPGDIRAHLKARGVPFDHAPEGSRGTSLIDRGLREGRPAMVATGPERVCGQGHWWAVVGRTPTTWLLYDPNRTHLDCVPMSDSKFRKLWDGGCIVIRRRK